MSPRYCPLCDDLVDGDPCPECGADTERVVTRKLTRQERLEGLADRGIDTFEDYRETK